MLGTNRIGTKRCEREPDVLSARSRAGLTADLEAHVAQCERCREALRVSAWMQQLADTSDGRPTLPDPGTLWWKAQVVRRWDSERRSAAPVESMERVELLAALVAIVLGAMWALPAMWQSLVGEAAVDTATVARVALTTDPSNLATYVGVALTLIALTTFYLLHRALFAEY